MIVFYFPIYRDCVKYYRWVSCLQRMYQLLQLGVMFTEIVSNIIAWCHAYRDCVKYYSLVSCIQRLCQILQLGVNVYRDCFKYYSLVSCLQRLFQIFSLMSCLEIVSNIIVWCHVYRYCVKYYSLVSSRQLMSMKHQTSVTYYV